MTWIERRTADLEAWKERNATIREHAVTIYEALWTRIVEHLNEAREKGIPVSTNGALQKRIVRLAKKPRPSEYFEFELALIDSKTRIRAQGDRVAMFLDLDISEDGVVCLKLGAALITVDQAAIRISDPFLFPQLPATQL